MSNDPLKLDELGEWAGLWWLPEAPGERLPGVLRYDGQGGLALSLIGAFEERIFQQLAPGVKGLFRVECGWRHLGLLR